VKLKKAILEVMDRDTLKAAVDDLELEGVDRRSREDMAVTLSRARQATPALLLEYLYEEQVKEVCELVGVSATGRRKKLIQRLARGERRRGNRGRATSRHTGKQQNVTTRRRGIAKMNNDDTQDVTVESEPQRVRLPDPPAGMMRVNKTELVWPGKYRDDGTLNEIPRAALPFQVIERVNESRATREAKKERGPTLFDMWEQDEGDTYETGWRNKLIWGNNLLVMDSLLEQFAGEIDLIYIDPPFAVGADFSIAVDVGDETLTKQPSLIEEKVYRDTWGLGIQSYLQMLFDRLTRMRELHSPVGSIYLHIGPQMNHYVRCLLSDVLGDASELREIVWQRVTARSHGNYYPATHDTILFYSMADEPIWNQQYTPVSEKLIKSHYNKIEEDTGRRYTLDNCLNQNKNRPNLKYEWNGHVRVWRWTKEKMQQLHESGRLVYTASGMTRYKRYLDEAKGTPIQSVWTDIRPVNSQAIEDTGYDTQKPEALLERIIETSSNPGSIVADFFCGSGTTAAVAERLGRRWIGVDLSRYAIHTTRKRLLATEGCRPFEVLNLGKYERQYWQGVTFGEGKEKTITEQAFYEYLAFILRLYGGQPVPGLTHLHGRKGRAMVHIGSVDAPVTIDEIGLSIEECSRLKRPELHVLGWEWEMGLYDLMVAEGKKLGIKLLLFHIPREVMEQEAVDRGDIQFFELAYLEVEIKQTRKLTAQVKLTDFVIPSTDLIPNEVRSKVKKWSDYIDYWSIDWNFQNDTFMQGWVAYRTRKERTLPLVTDPHSYESPGKYTVLVKVIDIFGNDTSQAHVVEVK